MCAEISAWSPAGNAARSVSGIPCGGPPSRPPIRPRHGLHAWEDLGRANDSIWARGVGGIVDHLCILWSLEYAPNILGQRFVIRSLRR